MRPTVIALAGLVLLAGTAAAQRLPRIGDIVRIETEGRDTVIGVVVPGPPGLLHVRRADWEVLSVARPLVSSISTYGPQWAKWHRSRRDCPCLGPGLAWRSRRSVGASRPFTDA